MKATKILYVGRVGTPTDAAGIRIYNIAKILREIGYDVEFICDREDYSSHKIFIKHDGFNYYFSESLEKHNLLQSVKNTYELLSARKIFARVKEYCSLNRPFAIILYNDMYSLTKYLIKYCKKNDIKLIADVTEWYEKRGLKKIGDILVPYFTDKRIRKLDIRVHNIISISPYLHKYYSNLGCNSIFIPPIFDAPAKIEIRKYDYYPKRVLNLVYAGAPGGKDIIWTILEAIEIINKEHIQVRLDLVGIDEMYLRENWKTIDFKRIAIFAHGKLPHEETLDIIRRADFGFLLRHNKRYAKAGFSTKLAECMMNGVPMICNSVGGAEGIIDSMNNGVIVENSSKETLLNILRELITMDGNDFLRMKENAYVKAKSLFSGINYKTIISDFLCSERKKKKHENIIRC